MIQFKGKPLSHGTRPLQKRPTFWIMARNARCATSPKKTPGDGSSEDQTGIQYILTSQHLGIFRKQHLIKSWKKINCFGFIGCNKTPWPPWPRRGRQLILPPHLAARPHAQLECIQHVQPVIVAVHAVDGKNPAPVEVGSLSHHS